MSMKNGEHMKWGFLKRTSMMILFKRSDDEPFYLKTRFLKLPVGSDAVEIGIILLTWQQAESDRSFSIT
jgi:hypothetical protein